MDVSHSISQPGEERNEYFGDAASAPVIQNGNFYVRCAASLCNAFQHKTILLLAVTFLAMRVNAQTQFTSLEAALKKPASVKSLVLKSKGLTVLPETIATLVNLERLDVSDNKLTVLPHALFQLKKLKYLNLTGNSLLVLPPAIGNLTNLEELEFGFNPISLLPKEIGQLAKLNRLSAPKNNLKSLPAEMGKLTKLTIIDFTYNNFITVPISLTELTNLKALDMAYNKQLSSYPPEIKNLQLLKIFGLKGTKITAAQVKELNVMLFDCTVLL